MHSSPPSSPRQISTRTLRGAGMAALLLLALIILWQAHRPDPATGQERSDRLAGALDAGHWLEQSFIAGRDNLRAIDVFPRIPPGRLNPRYTLTLRLREDGAAADLAVARVRLVDARARQRITFAFPAQPHSRGKGYRLRVETDAPADTVSLLASAEDAYFDGELRQNGLPSGFDLAFRAHTAILTLGLLDELAGAAAELGLLAGVTLLLGAAGAAALSLLDAWPDRGAAERGLWGVGAGLALAPLVFLLAGSATPWVFAGLFLLALARAGVGWKRSRRKSFADFMRTFHPADCGLLLLFLWALAVRLLQIRDILVPPWVDGLAHIQMAQSILDAGRMPGGLLYHVGFHAQAALLHNLTGLPIPRLMVLFGQLISALNGPALYVLVKSMYASDMPESDAQGRRVGFTAALALTVFPSLPSYLINWGRYPFLLGLALLPFTLAATVAALRQPPGRAALGRYALAAMLLGGQLLSHYGTLSFWLSFTLVFLAIERPAWTRRVRPGQAVLAGLGLLALALLAGYLRFGDNLAGKLSTAVAESRQVSEELDYNSIWQINLRAGGVWLVLAGAGGALWAGLRARKTLFLAAGWFLAQAALIALQSPWLGYALASFANLMLALPLPLAILAGSLLAGLLPDPEGNAQEKSKGNGPTMIQAIRWNRLWGAAALIALAAAGGLSQTGILNPTTLLYSPADDQAAGWIRANLPPDARFLVNSRAWSGAKIVPADGGGWITIMTGRESLFVEDKSQLAHLPETIDRESISHIYLGRFSGYLAHSTFEQDPTHYRRIYHEGGIDIYEVVSRK